VLGDSRQVSKEQVENVYKSRRQEKVEEQEKEEAQKRELSKTRKIHEVKSSFAFGQ